MKSKRKSGKPVRSARRSPVGKRSRPRRTRRGPREKLAAQTAASASNVDASPFQEIWLDDLLRLPNANVDWLWDGYLARGAMTLLTSQWKTGKTTLLSLLLARMARGGTLAGRPVSAARAVVVSEESPELWRQRHQRLRFGRNVCLICRPFSGKPSHEQWLSLLGRLRDLHEQRDIVLAVIDPVSLLLPAYFESHAEKAQSILAPLSQLAARGMSVLLLHHPRKGDVLAGQAARGSGAICAMVDLLLELNWVKAGDAEVRRRRLLAWSRYEGTPREQTIELTADGKDYRVCQSAADEPFEQGWPLIEALLQDRRGQKLSRQQIYDDWPDRRKPSRITLWRWLERAVALRRLCQEGEGLRHDPYRYWLPGDKATWRSRLDELLSL